jgi:hypothetical protein
MKNKKSSSKPKEQPEKDPSTMSSGERSWQWLQEMPYSEDRIGQGFVIAHHIPSFAPAPSKKEEE